jgi:hypothetical protein
MILYFYFFPFLHLLPRIHHTAHEVPKDDGAAGSGRTKQETRMTGAQSGQPGVGSFGFWVGAVILCFFFTQQHHRHRPCFLSFRLIPPFWFSFVFFFLLYNSYMQPI